MTLQKVEVWVDPQPSKVPSVAKANQGPEEGPTILVKDFPALPGKEEGEVTWMVLLPIKILSCQVQIFL